MCIWLGEVLIQSALLIYGFTLHYHEHVHWFASIFAVDLGRFGLQIITTTCYTYTIDCYGRNSAQVAQVFNFARQIACMTVTFSAKNLGDDISSRWLFMIYAVFGGGLAFMGGLLILWKGQRWREDVEWRRAKSRTPRDQGSGFAI